MNDRQAMAYIEELSSHRGIVPGLESIRELCRRLGDPQKRVPVIHIAGTNGKGSTLAYLTAILTAAGYRVGSYSSPAVTDYRERFMMNQKMIAKTAFAKLLERVAEAAEQMAAEGYAHPTVFEVETALAFCFFTEKNCDVAVVETGMGGLLDATNLIEKPLVSVLASISMDHMQFLGGTLAEIAAQKAGIIKEGCPVVSMAQKKAAAQVIADEAVKKHAPLFLADGKAASGIRYGLTGQSFHYGGFKNLKISLCGMWQIENACLAVETVRVLNERGFSVSEAALRKGLLSAQWRGRMTVLQKKPYVITDGAHNADAVEKLADSLSFYFTNKPKVFIMGVLRDKEYGTMIERMAPLAEQLIAITPPENPRALPAYELAKEIRKVNEHVTAADSLEEAVEMAYLLTPPEGVIVAFGSLSYLGRLEQVIRDREKRVGVKKAR
ncbi:MAG: bifunctional folylpolyglutamate synthase/dihydrofolate synthase [Lachnospiraceae bacterium]|nr:bifunctional folylpolyglutamate synthase/dihydrofolate synthase [Lachnospiraceae bacterium]